MKRIALISILLGLGVLCAYTQDTLVLIPDTAFVNSLIEEGVDTSGEGWISHEEARSVIKLDVTSRDITDMTGIEAFVNLDTLICSINELTSLDLSGCPALRYLDLSANDITDLNITWNVNLEYLDCGSHNVMGSLYPGNPLVSLDVSNNIALKHLVCHDCQLTSLNVSNCTQLTVLGIGENPNLTQVCVWTTLFPPDGVEVYYHGCPNVEFTTECTIGIEEQQISNITIYPNPTRSLLSIEADRQDYYSIAINSLNGKQILIGEMEGTTHKINLSSFQPGMYFITIRSKDFVTTRKIIKL